MNAFERVVCELFAIRILDFADFETYPLFVNLNDWLI